MDIITSDWPSARSVRRKYRPRCRIHSGKVWRMRLHLWVGLERVGSTRTDSDEFGSPRTESVSLGWSDSTRARVDTLRLRPTASECVGEQCSCVLDFTYSFCDVILKNKHGANTKGSQVECRSRRGTCRAPVGPCGLCILLKGKTRCHNTAQPPLWDQFELKLTKLRFVGILVWIFVSFVLFAVVLVHLLFIVVVIIGLLLNRRSLKPKT